MSQPITPPAKSKVDKYNITINNAQGLVSGDNAEVTQISARRSIRAAGRMWQTMWR